MLGGQIRPVRKRRCSRKTIAMPMRKPAPITGVSEVVLSVADLPKMRAFYTQIMGFHLHSDVSMETTVANPDGGPTITGVPYNYIRKARLSPNHALQRTRPSRPGCNPTPSWAGSLSWVVRRARVCNQLTDHFASLGIFALCGRSLRWSRYW